MQERNADTGPIRQSGTPLPYPALRDAPLYLPNLIAAIVVSVAIVVGSIGTWVSFFGLAPQGGTDMPDSWGVVTLVLGGVCAIATFALLNWGRTNVSLRLAVPMTWTVVVAGVGCLAIALVHIARVNSFSQWLFGTEHVAQVGWGLWLVAISAAVLCVAAVIVAVQVGNASQDSSQPPPASWISTWRWIGIAASAFVLLFAVFNAYKPLIIDVGHSQSETETHTVTAEPSASTVVLTPERRVPAPAPTAGPDGAVPADAKHCSSNPVNVPFNNSAANDVTSCPFAEAVRNAYVGQDAGVSPVTLYVFSPVISQTIGMTCTGTHVVTCTGGNNAVVYLF